MARRDSLIRVLHFNFSMGVGGIETWLLHVCRHLDRNHFHFSFGLESLGGELESAIRGEGMEVHPVPRPLYVTLRPRLLQPLLSTLTSPQVVHSHSFSYGPMLRAATKAGIACRISHIHNSEYLPPWSKPYQRLTMHISWYWVRRYATHILAASWSAAEACLGKAARRDPRVKVLYCGIDLSTFHTAQTNPEYLRREANIPADAVVIGHVGRHHEQKNHQFIIKLAPEILRVLPNAYFVFVGDGPLRHHLEGLVRSSGLQHRFRFLGVRHDVPDLMRSQFDVFFFPSLYEGLPLVVLEAQAAGLPVLCSTEIPEEAVVIPNLVRRLDLKQPREDWVRAIAEAIQTRRRIDPEACLRALIESDFNIENAVKRLEKFYWEITQHGKGIPTRP